MNTSIAWIKAYVPDLNVTAQEYTDAMTLSGTKVENYTCLDKNLEKIVVGEIVKIERHPDADKLIVCQVNVGDETIQIVTGAPNVKETRFLLFWTAARWPAAMTAALFLKTESASRRENCAVWNPAA